MSEPIIGGIVALVSTVVGLITLLVRQTMKYADDAAVRARIEEKRADDEAAARQKLRDAHNTLRLEYTATLEKRQAVEARLQLQIDHLIKTADMQQDAYNALKQTNEALTRNIEILEKRIKLIDPLQSEVAELKTTMKTLNEAIAKLKSERDVIQETLDKERQKSEKLTHENGALKAEKQALLERISVLEASEAEVKRRLQTAEQVIEKLEQKILVLEQAQQTKGDRTSDSR